MKSIFLSFLTFTLLSGCATIINDKAQPVNLTTTDSQKLDVIVNGQHVTAPGVVYVQRSKSDLIITAKGKNCKGKTAVESSVDGIFWGNVIIGGILGSATDATSDKMWTYDEHIQVNCQ